MSAPVENKTHYHIIRILPIGPTGEHREESEPVYPTSGIETEEEMLRILTDHIDDMYQPGYLFVLKDAWIEKHIGYETPKIRREREADKAVNIYEQVI